jgi:hypothetical protein
MFASVIHFFNIYRGESLMKKLAIIITALITMGTTAWGQQACPDPSDCIQTGSGTETLRMRLPDCTVTIDYVEYNCNGVVSIRWSNPIIVTGCGGWTNFSIYHYNINSLEDYITLGLLDQLFDSSTIGNCTTDGSGGTDYINVYTANCGIWVGCEYTVDPASEICDNGYQPPSPVYDQGGTPKVKVYKWQPCGTICCENVYSLCRGFEDGGTFVNITKLSSGPQGNSQCSEEANYAPKQCQNGCM